MRVVMVSKACIVGAYQTKLEALARLPEIDLTVIVPPSWKGPEGETRLERKHLEGYRLIESPIRFNGRFHIHYYPEFPLWLRRLQPDIVHFDEEPYNLATFLGLRAAKTRRIRSLFFSWQNLYRRYPWPFQTWEQACFRMAGYALAGNQDAAHVLRSKGYAGPLAIIPQFGVDTGQFARPLAAARMPSSALRIGYAGRLVPEKGLNVLLDALARLDVPWRAVLAGTGPEEASLRAQAQALQIAERVHFAGRIGSTEMPAFFRDLDVLVLPSLSRPNWVEQFGRVLVEAMACEVAVVGSDSGEIPHVIGDAGLVFHEGDSPALTGCLKRLAEDTGLLQQLQRAGRRRVLARFTQEQIARETRTVYQALLEAPLVGHGSMV